MKKYMILLFFVVVIAGQSGIHAAEEEQDEDPFYKKLYESLFFKKELRNKDRKAHMPVNFSSDNTNIDIKYIKTEDDLNEYIRMNPQQEKDIKEQLSANSFIFQPVFSPQKTVGVIAVTLALAGLGFAAYRYLFPNKELPATEKEAVKEIISSLPPEQIQEAVEIVAQTVESVAKEQEMKKKEQAEAKGPKRSAKQPIRSTGVRRRARK